MRRAVATGALVIAVALVAVLPPRQVRIEGLSMLPGLAPGDVVGIGWRQRALALSGLARHRRWVFRAPDGTPTVKRLMGLPGERITIDAGDLVVDGTRLLTAPPLLRATASAVAATVTTTGATTAIRAAGEVYDDCPEAVSERRLLLPVTDGGAWALVACGSADRASRVTMALGEGIVTWAVERAAAVLVVVGRLEGRFVAGAWPAEAMLPAVEGARVPWPAGLSADWQVERPWQGTAVTPFAAEVECGEATVVAAGLWRDILHRPAADGTCAWVVGPREVWLIGDSPAVSHDCRHHGAIDRGRLLFPLESD